MIMNLKVFDNDVGGFPAYIPRFKPWLGAAVSALGGIAGSVMQNIENENRDDQQFERQLYLMREQNNYNSAPEQRKRLEEAGVNPLLAFGSGNTGAVGSTPSVPQHTPVSYNELGAGMIAAGSQVLQSQQIEAQNRNLDADTEIKRQQAMTQYSRDMANLQKTLAEENLSKGQYYFLSEQLYQLKDMYDLVKANNYAQLQQTLSVTALNHQMKLAKAFEMELANKRYFLDKALNDSQRAAIAQTIAESVARIQQTNRSLDISERAVANEVIHAMNQDAAAFENLGISKEMMTSEKFKNYVSSVASPIIGLLGGMTLGRFGAPVPIKGFGR